MNKTHDASGGQSYLLGLLIASELFDMTQTNYVAKIEQESSPNQTIILVGTPTLDVLNQNVIGLISFELSCIDVETALCTGVLSITKAAQLI